MKKTALRKDTTRELKRSISRFLSITLIICLGVGFFTGMKATAPSMKQTAQQYFNETDLMDIRLLSAVGFGDDDIDAIRDVKGIKAIMPSYSTDVLVQSDTVYHAFKVMSLTENQDDQINKPVVLDGRMPEASGECVICKEDFIHNTFSVGDKINLADKAGSTKLDSVLKNQEYTVVGIVKSPLYFSYSYGSTSIGDGMLYGFMMVPESDFLYERYTEVCLTVDIDYSKTAIFTPAYYDKVKKVMDQIKPIGRAQCAEFIASTKDTLASSQAELEQKKEEAYKELDSSFKRLDDAKAQLEEAKNKLKDGWIQFDQESANYKQQIADAEQQIADAQTTINAYRRQLAESDAQYRDAKASAENQLAAGLQKLQNGWAEYKTNADKLNASKNQLNDAAEQLTLAARQIEEGKQQIIDNEQLLASSAQQLKDGRAQYESGMTEYQAGLTQYNSGKAEYDTAYQEYIADLQAYNSSSLKSPFVKARLDKTKEKLDEAKVQLDEASATLTSTKAKLDAAAKEISDGQIAYDKGVAELAQAKKDIASGETTYYQQLETFNKGQAEWADGQKQLESAKAQLDQGQAEYDAQKAQGDARLEDAYQQLQSGYAEIEASQAELDSRKDELYVQQAIAEKKFNESKEELDEADDKIDVGEEEYQEGLTKYETAKKDAEEQLSDGASQIQSALAGIAQIERDAWYIFNRDDAVSNYASLNEDTARIDAIASIFPVFFLIVAALVCLTTMSRMVEEQRTQMGTYKALGYSTAQILIKYLSYAFFASIVGGIIGQLCCIQVFPRAISTAYSALYALPPLTIVVPWVMVFISLAVGLACTVLVTLICCQKETRSVTAALMRPKAPKVGKKILLERIPGVWNLFNFSYKITIRNLFRYKVRFLMTVVGISGCMALIVSGFGLQNAISPIVDLQFDGVCTYDYTVSMYEPYDTLTALGCKTELLEEDKNLDQLMFTKQLSGTVSSKEVTEQMKNTFLYVPENQKNFESMIHLQDYKTGKALKMQEDAAVITEKMAKNLNVGIGDNVIFHYDNKEYSVKVCGIAENYVYHYIYIMPKTYEKLFDEEVTYNSFIGTTKDEKIDSQELLSKNANFLTVIRVETLGATMGDTLKSMYFVVAILIIAAACLAIVVLYNLTNINISERVREIATIKVLGFNHTETDLYVFRENMIMTVIGVIFGNIFGYLLAQVMINMVEVDMVMFSRAIRISSYIFSTLITLVITALVTLLMSKKIKNISMVESLKSIE